MEPNSQPATTPTATQPTNPAPAPEPQQPAGDPAAPPAEDRNINDLNTEITEQEEQSLVNQVLGLPQQELPAPDSKQPEPQQPAEPAQPKQPSEPEPKPRQPAQPQPQPEPQSEPELKEPDTTIQTDDLWVEVDKVVKNEDGTTKTEKVKLVYDPNNPGSFVPDDFQFLNDRQLFEILEAKSEMAKLYQERQAEVKEKQEEYQGKKTAVTTQQEQLAAWDAEVQGLIDAGILEGPKTQPGTPEFANDPTVQKVDAVFKFMATKNQELLKDGKPPIRTFTLAYNMYERDAQRKAEEETKKSEIAAKQQKGGMVGGSLAPSAGGSQGSYVAGSHSSMYSAQLDDEGNLI